MHVDHHALAVDVGDLQILGFLQAQATRVDRAQEGAVVRRSHAAQDRPHLLDTQDRRQACLTLGAQDVEEMPVALQHVHEEEPDAAVADAHRVRRPVVDVAPAQEVGLELRLGDLIGRLAIEGAEHPHRAGVGFLRAFDFAVELQGVDGALVPVGHHGSLLG